MLEVGIISPFDVFPPTFGGAVRTYQMVKNLGEMGCLVHLFVPESGSDFSSVLKNVEVYPSMKLNAIRKFYPVNLPGIRTHCSSLLSLLKRLERYRSIDIIQADHLSTALQGLALKKLLKKPAILSEHNVETLLWYQIDRVERQRWRRLRILEMVACKGFDHILTVSPFDKTMIEKLFRINPAKITVIPNGVDTQHFSPKTEDRHRIRLKYGLADEPIVLFSGRLNWFPNLDALKIMFSEVFPALKQLVPDAVFMIIGGKPPHWLTLRKGRDLVVAETSHHNMASYINAADVCIAPLRFGSGMCLKTLEYMSCGKPIVSTSIGARGLPVANKKHMIIEDNTASFAEQIAYLLNNKAAASSLGEEARKLVKTTYEWNIIIRQLIKVYENIISEN